MFKILTITCDISDRTGMHGVKLDNEQILQTVNQATEREQFVRDGLNVAPELMEEGLNIVHVGMRLAWVKALKKVEKNGPAFIRHDDMYWIGEADKFEMLYDDFTKTERSTLFLPRHVFEGSALMSNDLAFIHPKDVPTIIDIIKKYPSQEIQTTFAALRGFLNIAVSEDTNFRHLDSDVISPVNALYRDIPHSHIRLLGSDFEKDESSAIFAN